MEPNNNKIDVDPDYKINNIALRKIEEKDNKLTCDRVSKIIGDEFEKELAIREKQLEEIEEKIYKAQKLLHLVRYVLITSYYNRNGLECNGASAEYSAVLRFNDQGRIHPAVKKLLSGNMSLELLHARGKRKPSNRHTSNDFSTSHLHTTKKIKLEAQDPMERISNPLIIDHQHLLKSRKRSRYRIVVGNISKWMPSLENDNTTHKWMVYVRGIKDAPDISNIVSKVIFYLHPSYKPHDVVEISSYPFHLARRGWGEFPLRVQIFFKSIFNKPVSIVHNLKLDKTYTGRQTLGNETVLELYLHEDHHNPSDSTNRDCQEFAMTFENVTDFSNPIINLNRETTTEANKNELIDALTETVKVKSLLIDLPATCEHNYCHEEEITDQGIFSLNEEFSLLDHSYSLPFNKCKGSSMETDVPKSRLSNVNHQETNDLIYGLSEYYVEDNAKYGCNKQEKIEISNKNQCIIKTLTTANGQPIRFLPQSFNKILLDNGNVVQIQVVNRPQIILKQIDANTLQKNIITEEKIIDYEKYKVLLPRSRFKNSGEVLPYLFRRLPLWSNLARDLDYKCTYPYTATSREEFFSWNIGKKLSSEWSRAKTVKRIASTVPFPNLKEWSTKTFLMYGRSHNYSPASIGNLFKNHSKDLDLLSFCFSQSLLTKKFSLEGADIVVDITTDKISTCANDVEKISTIDISDATFVKEFALDCGVVLKSEEISEGVTMNVSERMIFEVTKYFADNLLRRARHHLVCHEDYSEKTSEITVGEINIALNERPEIKSIMTFQKRKREMEYFL